VAQQTAERAALYRDYEKLKAETCNVEEMKRTVEQIMREQEPEQESPKIDDRGYRQEI
jgi:hypothetical protein